MTLVPIRLPAPIDSDAVADDLARAARDRAEAGDEIDRRVNAAVSDALAEWLEGLRARSLRPAQRAAALAGAFRRVGRIQPSDDRSSW